MTTTKTPPPHEQLTVSIWKVLPEFMAGCSDDAETREVMTASLIFSFWQLAARGTMPQVPSMLLVRNHDNNDPVLEACRLLCEHSTGHSKPSTGKETYAGGDPALAPKVMLDVAMAEQKRRTSLHPGLERPTNFKRIYNDARISAYGKGRVFPFQDAWDPLLGLMTDERNSIILTLDRDEDKNSFLRHTREEPQKLMAPAGITTELDLDEKSLMVSGSLHAPEFDEDLVDRILELGKPYLFLAHGADSPINIPNYPALSWFGSQLGGSEGMRLNTCSLLPNDAWSQYYLKWIWERLCKLPANYRFCMLELVHKLHGVCQTLALYAGPSDGEPTPETRELARNLFVCALRSVALSLAVLGWHGLGFDLPCSLLTARKTLRLLRDEGGSVSLRDIQRRVGFGTASNRDKTLRELENQGLVEIDDKLVSACSYEEFVQNIREQLPTDWES